MSPPSPAQRTTRRIPHGSPMTPRGVTALGAGQLVNWGVLYYAFSPLLLPIEQDLGAPRWVVAGAFSVALLISALAAPTVGRAADRGHGPALVVSGGLSAAVLLAAWAAVPTVATLYIVWAGLGLCMAAALYEPIFTIIGRAIAEPGRRLAALARVTILGGLASTVFVPLSALLVQRIGWRGAVWCLAASIAGATLIVARMALLPAWPSRRPAQKAQHPSASANGVDRGALARLALLFGASGMATAAFTSNLVPALVERGCAPTTAAALAGLFGLMQLPGRVMLSRSSSSRAAASPAALLARGFLIQAAGFAALVFARSLLALGLGVAAVAFGAGLNALVRPYLVQTTFGLERSGFANGAVASAQQTSRAAGPIVAAGLYGLSGYGLVFGLFAAMFALLAVLGRPREAVPSRQVSA